MKRWAVFALALACAGVSRDCSSCTASNFGGDWIIVEHGMDGRPYNCWQLRATAVENEPHTDGIYWQSPEGHLVHISGWYERVQVKGLAWESAAKTVGVDLARCVGGAYRP